MPKGASQIKTVMGQSIRFEGLKDAAKSLKCSDNHLRFVLKGVLHDTGVAVYPKASRRRSKSLEAKIRAQFPALLAGAK